MKPFPKRADKLTMLSKIVEGRLTSKDVSDLRKSREPIYLTLNLGENDIPQAVNDPCYHINIYKDGTVKRYWQFANGRIEDNDYLSNQF